MHTAVPARYVQRVAHIRAFHSPFVALSGSNHLTTPPSNAAPVYEKQNDTNPEPHLSSSGTRTYVVSEPDPSNTPYEVPSGAYPASAAYNNPSPIAAQREGEGGAVRSTGVPGGKRRGASHGGIDLMDATSAKQGKF